MRGSGSVTLGNNIAKFKNSPRLYISQEDGIQGWEQVEFIAYGKLVEKGGTPYKSYAGMTLVARTNHNNYASEPCDAFGYYARIYQETGECSFQKEYYHSATTGTIYSPSRRVDCFEGGLPLNQWIGMKFKVYTVDDSDNVQLELYIDENDDGNWVLKHSLLDSVGNWFSSSSSQDLPSECTQNDGDTVLGPRNSCFLRTDGDSTTEYHWRDASIANQLLSNNGPCVDSPLKMSVYVQEENRRRMKTCSWVGNSSTTSELCNDAGISSHCPITCGSTCEKVDSSMKFRVVKPNGKAIRKKCKFFRKKSTKKCVWDGARDTCRETCA